MGIISQQTSPRGDHLEDIKRIWTELASPKSQLTCAFIRWVSVLPTFSKPGIQDYECAMNRACSVEVSGLYMAVWAPQIIPDLNAKSMDRCDCDLLCYQIRPQISCWTLEGWPPVAASFHKRQLVVLVVAGLNAWWALGIQWHVAGAWGQWRAAM